jgi:ABC-type polysaccharide/polyol phosphate export permease
MLFTTIFATISVVEDRQQGFLQSVLVAPGSRTALVVGKVLGVTTLAAVQIAIFLAFSPLAGFRAREVRWLPLIGISLLTCVGLTAMNFTVAWVLDSVQAYHAIMGVVLFPLWFLSGAMFPPPAGPLGKLMLLNPLTHAVDGLRAALARDALGVPGVGLPVALTVLAAYAAAMIALASWTCRRRGA